MDKVSQIDERRAGICAAWSRYGGETLGEVPLRLEADRKGDLHQRQLPRREQLLARSIRRPIR